MPASSIRSSASFWDLSSASRSFAASPTLASPGPLNYEQPFSPVQQRIDGLPLPITELGGGIPEGEPEKFESSSRISHAFIPPLSLTSAPGGYIPLSC